MSGFSYGEFLLWAQLGAYNRRLSFSELLPVPNVCRLPMETLIWTHIPPIFALRIISPRFVTLARLTTWKAASLLGMADGMVALIAEGN